MIAGLWPCLSIIVQTENALVQAISRGYRRSEDCNPDNAAAGLLSTAYAYFMGDKRVVYAAGWYQSDSEDELVGVGD